MSTEFDDEQHYGLFLTGTELTSETAKSLRQSALTTAAMRAMGMLDNVVDDTTPPATDQLWLDKNTDPYTLKIWDEDLTAWRKVTYTDFFSTTPVSLAKYLNVSFEQTFNATERDRGRQNLGVHEAADVLFNSVSATALMRINIIDEMTTGSGVTVDGVVLKDGLVSGRDVSVDGTKLDGIQTGAQVNTVTSVSGRTGDVVIDWTDVQSKPTTFPPESHTHDAGDIVSGELPNARLPERLQEDAQSITDWNTAVQVGFYSAQGAANGPDGTNWYLGIVEAEQPDWVTQTAHAFRLDAETDTLTWRRDRNNGTWTGWYRLRLSEAEQRAVFDTLYAPLSHTHTLSQVTDSGAMAAEDDAPSDGQRYARRNGAWATIPDAPASTFLDLGDTPANYSGSANFTVKVKADETGLEFVNVASGGGMQPDQNYTITGTWDYTTPPTINGTAISLVGHTHPASDIASGTLANARLPERLQEAGQTVTNWDTAITAGFYKGTGATNAPEPTGTFYAHVTSDGSVVHQTAFNPSLGGAGDTKTYERTRASGGTWGAWYRLRISETEQQAINAARYLALTGGTLSGATAIEAVWPILDLKATSSGTYGQLRFFQENGIIRWVLRDNSDGSFVFDRFDANGNFVDIPLIIDGATGTANFNQRPTHNGAQLALTSEIAPPARLGEAGEIITDWDTATQNGFFRSNPGANNTPEGAGASTQFWFGFCFCFDTNSLLQTAVKAINADATGDEKWERRGSFNGAIGVFGAWKRVDHNALDARYLRKTSSGDLSLADSAAMKFDGNVGDAATNTAEINTLLASLPAAGGILRGAPGTIAFNTGGVSTITNKEFTFEGCGKGVTNFLGVGTTGGLFSVSQNSQKLKVRIANCSILKHSDASSTGGALSFVYPSVVASISDTIALENVECRGANETTQYGALATIDNAWHVRICKCEFEGVPNTVTATGAIVLQSKTTAIWLDQVKAYWANSLLYGAPGFGSEGHYLTNCQAVATNYLFQLENGISAPGFHISNCHAETFQGGLRLINRAQVQLSNVHLYKRLASNQNWIGIYTLNDVGAAPQLQMTNVQMFGFKGAAAGGTAVGLFADRTNSIMGDLYVNGMDTGVDFAATATGVLDMKYYNVTTPTNSIPAGSTVTATLMAA